MVGPNPAVAACQNQGRRPNSGGSPLNFAAAFVLDIPGFRPGTWVFA